ncbi:MAG: AraC family transcriptional regulator [Clostridia bacterium]|nr:AraC family transcriptional regulator [Clostridia bacterium]
MVFSEMHLIQFQRIAYARDLKLDYQRRLGNGRFFEIQSAGVICPYFEVGFVEENPLNVHFRKLNTSIRLEEGDVYVLVPHYDVDVMPVNPGIHRRKGVEFLVNCTSSERIADTLTGEDLARIDQWNVVLPFVIPDCSEKDELKNLVRLIIQERQMNSDLNYYQECLWFMQCVNLMRNLVKRIYSLEHATPAQMRYCRRAKEFILANLERHLTVSEIADYVGIHKNYLTNVFSQCEHMRVMEYVNRKKLSRMMDRILHDNYSLTEAAEEIGFQDVDYVSKIFKKYNGITISEYRRLHNGEDDAF